MHKTITILRTGMRIVLICCSFSYIYIDITNKVEIILFLKKSRNCIRIFFSLLDKHLDLKNEIIILKKKIFNTKKSEHHSYSSELAYIKSGDHSDKLRHFVQYRVKDETKIIYSIMLKMSRLYGKLCILHHYHRYGKFNLKNGFLIVRQFELLNATKNISDAFYMCFVNFCFAFFFIQKITKEESY